MGDRTQVTVLPWGAEGCPSLGQSLSSIGMEAKAEAELVQPSEPPGRPRSFWNLQVLSFRNQVPHSTQKVSAGQA